MPDGRLSGPPRKYDRASRQQGISDALLALGETRQPEQRAVVSVGE